MSHVNLHKQKEIKQKEAETSGLIQTTLTYYDDKVANIYGWLDWIVSDDLEFSFVDKASLASTLMCVRYQQTH